MHFQSTTSLLILLCSSLVEAANYTSSLRTRLGSSASVQECATLYNPHEEAVMKELFERQKLNRRQDDPAAQFSFDVNFNVVAADMTYYGGWVPDSQIEAQMEILNEAYSPVGITFNHASTTRILSPIYFSDLNVPESQAAERFLFNYGTLFRRGGAGTLNINLISFGTDDETYGFAVPPSLYSEFPKFDGIYVRYTSLPGGASRVRQGSTVVHEVGHWLSLWHTFQNGCSGEGDGVDDTPPQRGPTTGCPSRQDSCPDQLGEDLVHNYMDYSAEGCRNSFTPGQIKRMREAATFRNEQR